MDAGKYADFTGMSIFEAVRKELLELSEDGYREFNRKLLPGTENILGVRLPLLRKEAKKIVKADWKGYLEAAEKLHNSSGDANSDPMVFFEEIMLSGMVIGLLKAVREELESWEEKKQNVVLFEDILKLVERFVPKIDNWSVCDSFCAGLKIAKEYKEEAWEFLMPYLKSDKEYFIRFGVVMVLNYYIEEGYIEKIFPLLDDIGHEGYYAKMAVAWALSMCYVKFPDRTLRYLRGENHLDDFTYNKALQKATESLSVEKTEKEKLRTMKR